jgi:WD40 repeat protein
MRALLICLVGCSAQMTSNPGTLPVRYDDVDTDIPAAAVQRTVLASSSERVVAGDHVHFDGACSVAIDSGAPAALSDDGTTMASVSGGELAIWDARTCDKLESAALTRIAGIAFIGSTRDVIVLHDAKLSKISETRSASVPIGEPSSFAISPDGTQLAIGIAGRAGTLVVWDLERMQERAAIELPIVDRAVDGVAFARDGKSVVATIPVHARYRRGDHHAYSHLAVKLDTKTWKSTKKVAVSAPYAPRSLVATDDAIVWDGIAFGWNGDSYGFGVYPWQVSAGGSVAAVSTQRGYFTWQRDQALPAYSAGIQPELEFRAVGQWIVRGVARDRSLLFCTATRCVAVTGP